MGNLVNKKVPTTLVGVNGNAYAIMGHFQKEARRNKWTQEEINLVLDEAKSGDYNHLLATIMDYCEEPGDDELLEIEDNEAKEFGEDEE